MVGGMQAQGLDSLQVSLATTVTAATQAYQPLWLVSNQYGALADRQLDLSSHLRITNAHFLGGYDGARSKVNTQTGLIGGGPPQQGFAVRYGLDLYNNAAFRHTFLQEAYVKLSFRRWEVRGGLFRETIGEVDPVLSSGSLNISGNALPVPQVGLAVVEYTEVPYTGGLLQFKGGLSHGWLGTNRWYKHAFLHEKYGFLRLNRPTYAVYGGLHHYALWGGMAADAEPQEATAGYSTLHNYGVAVFPRPQSGVDHRAIIEFGGDYKADFGTFHLYHQTPYEVSQGMKLLTPDQLTGVSFTPNQADAVLKRVVVEFIYTRHMANRVYYNDHKYRTGWEYEDRVLGNPLLTNRMRASHYFPAFVPFDWSGAGGVVPGNANIVNPKVAGIHTGAQYRLGTLFTAQTRLTLVQNYGQNERSPFYQTTQCYTVQEVTYQHEPLGLAVSGAIGCDLGQLTRNVGVRLTVKKQLFPSSLFFSNGR